MRKNILHKILLGLAVVTLSMGSAKATNYTSNDEGGLFSNPSTWNQTMSQADWLVIIQSKTHNFEVSSTATVTVDDSLNVNNLTVNGNLVFGKTAGESKTVIVHNKFSVGESGSAEVANLEGTHVLKILGGEFENKGTVSFRQSPIKVVNVVFDGGSISGSGTTAFNNLEVASGTVTNNTDELDIDGSFTMENTTKFIAGAGTLKIKGNFTNKNASDTASFGRGTSTVEFAGSTVQTISGVNGKTRFNNVTVSGGGFVVISCQVDVCGNFEVKNESSVNTSAELHFYRHFTVAAGSSYENSANYTCFWGARNDKAKTYPTGPSHKDQTITIAGDVKFAGISCRAGSETGTKTIIGSINSTAEIRAWGNAEIIDDASTYNHTFSGCVVNGIINLQSPMRIIGGTIRSNDVTLDLAEYSLGSGNITIAGSANIRTGGTLNVEGDVEIVSGYLVLNGSYSVVGTDTTWYQAMIKGDGNNTMTVNNGTILYMRGADNFPVNFKNVIFTKTANAYYDADFNQTVRGWNYGNLLVQYKVKTLDSDATVANDLYVYSGTTSTLKFKMGNNNITVGYRIIDNYDVTIPERKSVITSSGTVTMKSYGNGAQYIYCRGNSRYYFHNLLFTSDDPLYAQTKYVYGNINVDGAVTVSNERTNELQYLVLDIDNYNIIGSNTPENIFTLNNNTRLYVSGADNFGDITETFTKVDLKPTSIVRFDATTEDQTIPPLEYGNISLSGSTAKNLESTITIQGWIDNYSGTPKLTVTDPNVIINIEGDWLLESDYVNLNPEAEVVFCGPSDQRINRTTLPNVTIRGNGVKTLADKLIIQGDYNMYSSVEFNADNRTIDLYGDWNNTNDGGGVFHQQNGTLNLLAVGKNQTIQSSTDLDNSLFYNITIIKGKDDIVFFDNPTRVSNNLTTTAEKGSIQIYGNTLEIGGDLTMYKGCDLIYDEGALLHLKSSETEQKIRNFNTSIIYPAIKFSGSAVKQLTEGDFIIDGDVTIDNDAIVASSKILKVRGDWNNSGTFNHSSEVHFDGNSDQEISASTFSSVLITGSGKKMLKGNINLSGWLKIDIDAVLDASNDEGTSSYDISVSGKWINNVWDADSVHTGTFIPRQGTVTFTGNSSWIYTGDKFELEANGLLKEHDERKKFHNVVVNLSDPSYYTGVYPLYTTDSKVKTENNDMYVENNFTINTGIFYFYWNRMFVGGNVVNRNGNLSMNSHSGKYSTLYLGGTEGEYVFDPGPAKTIRQLIIVGGGTYKLYNDYTQEGSSVDSLIWIVKGGFHLNHHEITMNSSQGHIHISKNGTLTIDSDASLCMYSNRKLNNYGNLNLVGKKGAPAKIRPAKADHYYYLIQYAGTIAANHYNIEGTRDNGLDIRGGSIDTKNNLKNGVFSASTGNALLTLTGLDWASYITVDSVTFNYRVDGSNKYPKYNVERMSGTGVIKFTNHEGTHSGKDHEHETAGNDLIQWVNPTGVYWTGGGDGINWHDGNNWSINDVPGAGQVVILDDQSVKTAYTVQIKDDVAEVAKLVVSKDVTLELVGKAEIENAGIRIHGDLTLQDGSKLIQTAGKDSLVIEGAMTNGGQYVHNGNWVVFNMLSGIHNLSVPANQPLGTLVVKGKDGTLSLLNTVCVADSVILEGATLMGNNATLKVGGNWVPLGGKFDIGTSKVYMNGDDPDPERKQQIKGGSFYSLFFDGKTEKLIKDNISVASYFQIESTSGTVNALASNIYMTGTSYWYNYAGPLAFLHEGNGTVVFSGSAAYIGSSTTKTEKGVVTYTMNTKNTTFNNIAIQGSSSKHFYDTAFVKGTVDLSAGTNIVMIWTGHIKGTTDQSTLISNGGGIYIYGEDNFPHDFKTVDLSAGTVYYRDSLDEQKIFPVKYSGLYLYNEYKTSGNRRVSHKVIDRDLVVTGTLTIYDSLALLEVRNHTITVTNGISMAAKGKQIDWGTNGTLVQVGGGWDVSANIKNFCNIHKKGTGYLYTNGDWYVSGDMIFDNETNLYMRDTTKIICTAENKKFVLGEKSLVQVATPSSYGYAFPQGFSSYTIPESSDIRLIGACDQIVYTGSDITYGILYFNNSAPRTVSIDGDLKVAGNFYNYADATVFDDGGNDLYFGGATVDLRTYTASENSTMYLVGNIEKQTVTANGNITVLNLNNINITGTGVKEINETRVNIAGDITVGAGSTFNCNDPVYFSGARITNNGTFNHYGNVFTFTGTEEHTDHTIDMGENNLFTALTIDDDNQVHVEGHGITIGTGTFIMGKNTLFDMATFTHKIGSTEISMGEGCVWNTENASFIFNRNTTQYIPAMVCKDIQTSTAGTKYLRGALTARNITIEANTGFAAGFNNDNYFDITVNGSWNCNGSFTPYKGTVKFESPTAANDKIIKSNGQYFYYVTFNQTETASSIYKLQDQAMLRDSMIIGSGATLCLNHNILTMGDDDANRTDKPFVPRGESIYVEEGGTLHVDGGATLQFNHYDDNNYLDVEGRLVLVGEPNANAVLTRSNGYDDRGTVVTIHDGASVAANYYQIQYLAPSGFVVEKGATVDKVNNFSNGIWSNMYTGKSYKKPVDKETVEDKFYYLVMNAEHVTEMGDDDEPERIENLSFNHGSTPVVGTHFNIWRDESQLESTDSLWLGGSINGAMGSKTYDKCPGGLVSWPKTSIVTWTGAVNSDWFNAKNWSPAETPDETKSVLIPLTTNQPIIYSAENAACKNLTITNGGHLLIGDGLVNPVVVHGSVDVQDGGVLSFENSGVLEVKGDWNVVAKGFFVPQLGTVRFTAAVGSISITPSKSAFYNLEFDGAATYLLNGLEMKIKGNLTINSGTIWPNNTNYVYTILGDYNFSNGVFNDKITGYIKFAGGNQTINNGRFSRVQFSNAGTKTLTGSFNAAYTHSSQLERTIIVDNGATLLSSGVDLNIAGNVYIESGSTFNDGGRTHTFTGYYWEATGAEYPGSGKIYFNGNHAQYIVGGTFHNLDLDRSTTYLQGDVTMSGDLTLLSGTFDVMTNQITGTGKFITKASTNIYTRGEDNYPRFSSYSPDESSISYYNGSTAQKIHPARYGNLYLSSNTVKTLDGDVTIVRHLKIEDNGGTLDAGNYNIFVGRHWYNQTNGRFVPGNGRVIFNGNTYDQYIYLGPTVENPFYNFEVNKTNDALQVVGPSVDLNITGSLTVTSGKLYCYNGYRFRIKGDMTVGTNGQIRTYGCYELCHEAGTCTIKTNGSELNDLIINGGLASCKFVLNDDITVLGNFTLQRGKFDQNGYTATLGNSTDNAVIYGEYNVSPNGVLRIGNMSSFIVKSGGKVNVVGTESKYAMVTNNTGSYYFTIESGGEIAANYYSFAYLAKQGLIISDGALIDKVNNFSNGSFNNVVSAGVCLDIRNSQTFDGEGLNFRIENISFPNNPGGGAVNIKKSNASGHIVIFNATGMLSGALYENDPFDRVDWTGDVEYVWTAGANNNDWFDERNWSANINGEPTPSTIPNRETNVVIPYLTSGNIKYPIITEGTALAKKLTINQNAKLEINSPEATAVSLVATSDVIINGNLNMTNETDTIETYGNWVMGNTGTLTQGEGTVKLSGVGVKTIYNRYQKFNNLVIDNNGTVTPTIALTILGNFIIKQGVFDVTSSNYKITVGKDFTCKGTFKSQAGNIDLVGTGSHRIDPGSSIYYNINVLSGNYSLYRTELNISHYLDIRGGSFAVQDNTINLGDGSGIDMLIVNGNFNMGDNAKLKMGNLAQIVVQNGGHISLIGHTNFEPIVTSQNNSSNYSFKVESGATISANFYKIERVNKDGLKVESGAIIDPAANLSNGQFISGATNGQYLWLENNVEGEDPLTISNVYFNKGPKVNVKRKDGTGVVSLCDAEGVLAGYYFEDDDLPKAPDAGKLIWTYTSEVLYWVGGDESCRTCWGNQQNWRKGGGGTGTPGIDTRVIIPGTDITYFPIINDVNAEASGVDIYPDASLTLANGKNLTIANSLSIYEDATLTASDGVNESTIRISGQLSNSGEFNHGEASTVIWNSGSSRTIDMNGKPFWNFEVANAGESSVTFSVVNGESLVVEKNFTITSGTVNCNGGTLEVGGDFTITNGTFLHGNGTVKMNGDEAQTLSSPNADFEFYKLEFSGEGSKYINSPTTVLNTISIGSEVYAPEADLTIKGNWICPSDGTYSNNFHGGENSKVIFKGTSMQSITKDESFTNVEFNNTSSAPAFSTNFTQTISGTLELTKGVIQGSASKPIKMTKTATLLGGGLNCYINGLVEKTGYDDFLFPIGGTDRYAPIEITELGEEPEPPVVYPVFAAAYFPDAHKKYEKHETLLNLVSSKEYWTLNRKSGDANPRVTLYWNDREFSDINDIDVMSIVNFSKAEDKWKRITEAEYEVGTDIIAEGNTGKITSPCSVTSFGDFTFGFTYPTIVWRRDNTESDVFALSSNWEDGNREPNSTTNVKVGELNDEDCKHPVVKSNAQCYDLTLTSGGTLEIAEGITLIVNGNATFESGSELILNAGSSIKFLKDVVSDDAALVSADPTSTVKLSGNCYQEMSLNQCGNILIEGGRSKTEIYTKKLNSNLIINGNLRVETFTIFDVATHTLEVYGDFSLAQMSSISGNASYNFVGTSKQMVDAQGASLYNVTINNTSETKPQIELQSTMTVTKNLNLVSGLIKTTSQKILLLEKDAISSRGNANAYVVGPMKKVVTGGSFIFPIGCGSNLGEIGVSGLSSSLSYYLTAEYTDSQKLNTKSFGTEGLDNASTLENWSIKTGSNNTNPYITLYWQSAEKSEIGRNLSLLGVGYYNSGKWYSLGINEAESKYSTDDGPGYIKSNTTVNLNRTISAAKSNEEQGSYITYVSKSHWEHPLPIELFSFDATVTPNNDVRLNWSTASEHNNAYFTIEHTFNGETEMIADVAAQGVAGEGADYSYLHINQPAGTHYYRLHQTDFDGTTTVASDWVAVIVEDAELPVLQASVAPNPGHCQNIKISVSGISGGKFRYVVADMSGQTVIDRTVGTAGATSYQIDALDWNLQPSVYLIKVFTDNGQTVSKFVVE